MKTLPAVSMLTAVQIVLLAAGTARGQLVVGNAATTGAEIKLFDLSGANAPRVLVSGTPVSSLAMGVDTDNVTPVLYWAKSTTTRTLSKGGLTGSGLLSPVSTVGVLSTAMRGLAWDAAAGSMCATTFANMGTLNPSSASYTAGFVQGRLDGLAYDAGSDAFYVLNNQATSLQGPGIYRIGKPWGAPTFTRVGSLPSNGDASIVGLAAGDGRLFLTRGNSDATFPYLYVYNLAAGVYEQNAPTLTFTNNSGSASGAVWAPGLITPAAGTNLVVSAGASESCTIGPGGTLVFSAHITNMGADASGPVTVTVDLPAAATATFLTSTPAPTSTTATQLVYSLPPIAGYGAGSYRDITINLTAVGPGADATVNVSAATTSDTNPANNSASATTSIQVAHPATGARAVLSTISTAATSLVPGGGGTRFTGLDRPFASASGNWWVLHASTNAPTASNQVVLRTAAGGAPAVSMQTGVTSTTGGLMTALDIGAKVNDSGLVGFSGTDSSPSTSNGIMGVINGATITEVAREGSPIPFDNSLLYGSLLGNLNILASGQLAFGTSSTSVGVGCFGNNGTTLIARSGVTQPAGAPAPITGDGMPIWVSGAGGLMVDATGSHTLYEASVPTTLDPFDQVLVADGTVVLQSLVTVLPGMSQPISNARFDQFELADDGTWMTFRGGETTTPDWVARGQGTSITQVIKSGDPVFTGATETWAKIADPNPNFPKAFSYIAGGAGGHFLVVGNTNNTDTFANRVLVYDNSVVLARANDPVDVDGNGVFDDGYYIRQIGRPALTNDNAVIVQVSLRNSKAALCRVNDAEVGAAILRIPLPSATGACCGGLSCTVSTQSACAGTYKGNGTTCAPTGSPNTCCPADFDGANGLQVADIFAFLNAWFAGTADADFDHANGLQVADIFAFLNAWFAGC